MGVAGSALWLAQIADTLHNGALGIANREYVTNEDKSQVLDTDKLALVKDAHVAMALRLEGKFGLRREEAIKFTPARDDRGDRIRLKGSTTKGGRPREVPVLKDSRRKLLDEARRLAGSGALIPPERNYRQQLKVYESQRIGPITTTSAGSGPCSASSRHVRRWPAHRDGGDDLARGPRA